MGIILALLLTIVLLVVSAVVWAEVSCTKDYKSWLKYLDYCLARANELFGTKFKRSDYPDTYYDTYQSSGDAMVSVYVNGQLSRAVFIVKRLTVDPARGIKRLIGFELYNCNSSGTVSCYGHFSRELYIDIMQCAGYHFISDGEKIEDYYNGTNSSFGEHFILQCSDGPLVRECEKPEFYNPFGFVI